MLSYLTGLSLSTATATWGESTSTGRDIEIIYASMIDIRVAGRNPTTTGWWVPECAQRILRGYGQKGGKRTHMGGRSSHIRTNHLTKRVVRTAIATSTVPTFIQALRFFLFFPL